LLCCRSQNDWTNGSEAMRMRRETYVDDGILDHVLNTHKLELRRHSSGGALRDRYYCWTWMRHTWYEWPAVVEEAFGLAAAASVFFGGILIE
jgi:hypothetical protein